MDYKDISTIKEFLQNAKGVVTVSWHRNMVEFVEGPYFYDEKAKKYLFIRMYEI